MLELFNRGGRGADLDWYQYERLLDTPLFGGPIMQCYFLMPEHTGPAESVLDMLRGLYNLGVGALDVLEAVARTFGRSRADAEEVLGKWGEKPCVPGHFQEPWVEIEVNKSIVRLCGQRVKLQTSQISILKLIRGAKDCICSEKDLPKGDLGHRISRIRSAFRKAALQIKDDTLRDAAVEWSKEIIPRKEGLSYRLTHPERIRLK